MLHYEVITESSHHERDRTQGHPCECEMDGESGCMSRKNAATHAARGAESVCINFPGCFFLSLPSCLFPSSNVCVLKSLTQERGLYGWEC